ncbi:MAG TPA: PAS domain S-box protein, partial [Candidatus Caenarcaniphilales bacterium]
KAQATSTQAIPLNQGWPAQVLATAKPYFLEDLSQLPCAIQPPAEDHWGVAPQAVSLMLLPLRSRDRTLGSLNFSSSKPGTYSVAWRNLAELFAGQIGSQLNLILAHQRTTAALKELASSQVRLKQAVEFHERMMQSSTDAIYTLDLAANFTLVNQQTAQLSGYSVEELLGFSFFTFFADDEALAIQKQIAATVSQGAAIHQRDAELICKDNSRKIITFSLAPLFLEGNISAIVGTAQDITERKRAEEALRVSGDKFSKAFRCSPDSITIIRLNDGRFVEVNDSCLRLTGYVREEMIGRNSVELNLWVNLEDRTRIKQVLHQQGSVRNLEFQLRIKSGEVRIGQMSAEILELEGEPCLLAMTRDITEGKQAEAVLLRAASAEAANQAFEKELIERQQVEEALRWSEEKFASA